MMVMMMMSHTDTLMFCIRSPGVLENVPDPAYTARRVRTYSLVHNKLSSIVAHTRSLIVVWMSPQRLSFAPAVCVGVRSFKLRQLSSHSFFLLTQPIECTNYGWASEKSLPECIQHGELPYGFGLRVCILNDAVPYSSEAQKRRKVQNKLKFHHR